jgi:hypothetical protein
MPYRSEHREWLDELSGIRRFDWWRAAGIAAELGSIIAVIAAGYFVGRHFGVWS